MSWTLEDPNNLNSTNFTFYWIQKVDSNSFLEPLKYEVMEVTINQIKVQKSDDWYLASKYLSLTLILLAYFKV